MKKLVGITLAVLGICLLAWLAFPLLSAGKKTPAMNAAVEARPNNLPTVEAPAIPEADPLPDGRDVYGYQREQLPLSAAVARYAEHTSTAVLIDPASRRILWAKNELEPVPIASMTKLMTLLVVMEDLANDPAVTRTMPVTVTKAAASMGGTQVWIGPGQVYTLEELLTAMMVESANDAAYAIGEALDTNRDIAGFVARMNRTARRLGIRYATFYNVHGLPSASSAEESRASAMDMAAIALELQKYPYARELSALQRAEFKRPDLAQPLTMQNKNPLLGTVPGVTGMKTGFTSRAGFCLTATCERDGVLLIAVATGFPDKQLRTSFFASLFDWGYEIRGKLHNPDATTP